MTTDDETKVTTTFTGGDETNAVKRPASTATNIKLNSTGPGYCPSNTADHKNHRPNPIAAKAELYMSPVPASAEATNEMKTSAVSVGEINTSVKKTADKPTNKASGDLHTTDRVSTNNNKTESIGSGQTTSSYSADENKKKPTIKHTDHSTNLGNQSKAPNSDDVEENGKVYKNAAKFKQIGHNTDPSNSKINETTDLLNTTKERDTYRRQGIENQYRDTYRRTGTENRYRARKCLLIHDSTFSDFDKDRFSKEFDIKLYPVKKMVMALKDQKLKQLIAKDRPECIYVHLGLHDIIRSSTESVINSYESFMNYLLENTVSTICFSQIIPTANSSELNKKIGEVNRSVSNIITNIRKNTPKIREYLFSYNNSSVSWQNKKLQDGVKLTEQGKRIMWSKLNDGLRKAFRFPRPQLMDQSRRYQSNNSRNE